MSADHAQEESEESYYVSMTDLLVGMLFMFIIMLMAFALNLREEEEKFDATTQNLTSANTARHAMLDDIKHSLALVGVQVIIDQENGVLRLPEQLLFPRGGFRLTPQGQDALRQLAKAMIAVLPAYANLQGAAVARASGRLEAVFIEGHTDDIPIVPHAGAIIRSNWDLSAMRAIETFKALVDQEQALGDLTNDNHQRVLGVSGYAQYRPVRMDATEEARAANRRIDLRFLMATPSQTAIDQIRRDVQGREQ